MPKYQQKTTSYNQSRSAAALTLVGSTSIATVMGDASDTTYGKASSSAYPHDILQTATPALAAGERVVSVAPYCRSKQPGTKTVRLTGTVVWWGSDSAWHISEGSALALPAGVSTITNYELPAYQGNQLKPGLFTEWLWADIQYPGVAVYDGHTSDANRALIYESGVYAYATKRPSCAAPTAPTGTVSTTCRPTITFVLSAVVESWQVPAGWDPFWCGLQVQYSVYAGTLTTRPGTAPVAQWTERATIANYIDGTTASTLTLSTTPPVDLPNGALTIFVTAARDHPAGTYPAAAWSEAGAVAYKQWTQSVPLPTAPTLTLAASNASQYVTVTNNAPATTGYDSATLLIDVQRQMADGSWRDVRGMMQKAQATGSAIITGYDCECDRAVTNFYRARVSMWHTVDAVRRYSTWATANVTGPTFNGWNLKATDPAYNATASLLGAGVVTEPAEGSQAAVNVFEPLGRSRPVVTVGTVRGFAGSLEIVCDGIAAIGAMLNLEAYRGIVFLEDAFGGYRWIAISKVSQVRLGTNANPRRIFTVEYVEVDSGLGSLAT